MKPALAGGGCYSDPAEREKNLTPFAWTRCFGRHDTAGWFVCHLLQLRDTSRLHNSDGARLGGFRHAGWLKGPRGPDPYDSWEIKIGTQRAIKKGGFLERGRILLGGAILCLAVDLVAGQGSRAVVEAHVVLATEGAYPGSVVRSAAVAKISPGYHINDHTPTLNYLIPTELKLDDTKQVSVEKIVYPKGDLRKFAFSDTALSVYEATVLVGAILKIARRVPPGTYSLHGKFAYQACNDHACLPPASVPLELSVKVVSRSVPLKRVNGDVFTRIKFD